MVVTLQLFVLGLIVLRWGGGLVCAADFAVCDLLLWFMVLGWDLLVD